MEGLKRFYGIDDPQGLKFFIVHHSLDVEHSKVTRNLVAKYGETPEDEDQALERGRRGDQRTEYVPRRCLPGVRGSSLSGRAGTSVTMVTKAASSVGPDAQTRQMEVTFLGSSNAFASEGRYWSSFLVDKKYLFDAPPTLLPHLKQLEVPLADIEVLFLTHHHGDHFMGVPFLFLEYLYMTERTTRSVHRRPARRARSGSRTSRTVVYPEHHPGRRLQARSTSTPRPRQAAASGPGQLLVRPHEPRQGAHAGIRLPRRRSTARPSPTPATRCICDEVLELAEGSDVLVVDCTYTDGCGPEHMGLDDVKVIRERIAPETTIVLTHLNGRPHLDGLANVVTAEDLKTFRF